MPTQNGGQPSGVLTISLDFELFWGMRDHVAMDDYRANLGGTAAAIFKVLDLFEEYGIHATWATVGLVACEDREDALALAPALRPGYLRRELDPYEYLEASPDLEPALHFLPDVVERIRATPGQEIGTHTFSHFYCLEPGQTPDELAADLSSASALAQRRGDPMVSMVFPRNQFNPEHLEVLRAAGIVCFRGNESHWIYAPTESGGQGRLRRALRLIDAYINLSGHHTYPVPTPGAHGLVDLPASRFLRPYSARFARLDGLRLRRITRAMSHAAANGQVFHLWWHPHNFGVDTDANLQFLRRVLDHQRVLSEHHSVESLNMAEVASLASVVT